MTLVFDPIGKKGAGDEFNATAVLRDGISGAKLKNPKPNYSIVSGPASVTPNTNKVKCGSSSGTVIIKAIVQGPNFITTTAQKSFVVDASKSGQSIYLPLEQRGETLRDLPMSRKPIPIGKMFKTTAPGLSVSVVLSNNPNKIARIIGTGDRQMLVIAQKGLGDSEKFSGFGGADELSITLRATQSGNGSYHPAADLERTIKIKKPGKDAFFEERRSDDRFDSKKTAFKTRMALNPKFSGISDDKAARLFDSDNYDSDGDGVSNLLERAFGGDSLSNDGKSVLPRAIRKKDGYEYLMFNQYSDDYNSGDDKILYIVETSRDLRTWYPSTSAEGAEQIGTAVDLGGGMERVVWRSKKTRTADGNSRQYIRVRVKTR